MKSLMSLLGQNLIILRKKNELTQPQLAKLIGVSRATIARYESGEGGLDAKTIASFAKAFGIEEIELLIPDYKRARHLSIEQWESLRRHIENKIEQALPQSESPLPSDLVEAIKRCSPDDLDLLIERIWDSLVGLGVLQEEEDSKNSAS